MRHSLEKVSLFRDIGDEQREAIAQMCDWIDLPRGKTVLSAEDNSDSVFFVVSGRVAVKSFSGEGKEVTYSEISAGDLFGEFSAIDGQPRSAFVQTVESSVIASLIGKQFRDLVATVPGLGLKLSEHLIAKNRKLTERIYEYTTMSVRHRICAELLRLAEAADAGAPSVSINPAPSHYELSTRLSTHREAVSREMSALAAAGIVETGRQKLSVLNVPRLREIVLAEA